MTCYFELFIRPLFWRSIEILLRRKKYAETMKCQVFWNFLFHHPPPYNMYINKEQIRELLNCHKTRHYLIKVSRVLTIPEREIGFFLRAFSALHFNFYRVCRPPKVYQPRWRYSLGCRFFSTDGEYFWRVNTHTKIEVVFLCPRVKLVLI